MATISNIFKIAANRCWNTSPDCASNVEEAQLISGAARPLIITGFSGYGIERFLAVLNDSKATKADVMYCKGTIPNLKEIIAGRAYSEIYVVKASDELAQQIKLQFGKTMLPYRKETNRMTDQIWQIKL